MLTISSHIVINPQRVFDRVAKHLLTQDCRSSGNTQGTIGCRYRFKRKDKLLRCAIGCLIPKRFYNENLETKGTLNPLVIEALIKAKIVDTVASTARSTDSNSAFSLLLLNRLQSMHDNDSVEDWPRELANIARLYGLSTENIKS